MKIYLAGGGNKEDSLLLDEHFIRQLDENKTLIYIPHAKEPESYGDAFRWFQEICSDLGVKKLEMWTDLRKPLMQINQISGIYI